jgi:hypothetical protein
MGVAMPRPVTLERDGCMGCAAGIESDMNVMVVCHGRDQERYGSTKGGVSPCLHTPPHTPLSEGAAR